MPPSFTANAAEFGIEDPAPRPEDILRPTPLSSTTRRLTAREQERAGINYAMPEDSMRREQEALQMDALRDEAWDRKMTQLQKAAAWEDKIQSQQQGLLMLDDMRNLRPDSPDYRERVAELAFKYPMAAADKRVQDVLNARNVIAEQAEKAREDARRLEIARQERLDTEARQLENARTIRAEAASQEAAQKLSAAQIDPAEAQLGTLDGDVVTDPVKAERLIADKRQAEVSKTDFTQANRNLTSFTAQRNALAAQLREGKIYDPAAVAEAQAQLTNLDEAIRTEQEIVNQYRAAKGQPTSGGEERPPAPGVIQVKDFIKSALQ